MYKLMVARGEGIEGPRWKRWRDELQVGRYKNSYGDVKYTIENTDSNIVITVVPGGYLNYQGDHFVNLFNCLISMLYI